MFFNVSLSKMVPNGLQGLVKIKPLILTFASWAFSYASLIASVVILKLLELLHEMGTSCTPLLQLRSLLNLHLIQIKTLILRIFQKQSFYLYDVVVRSAYIFTLFRPHLWDFIGYIVVVVNNCFLL